MKHFFGQCQDKLGTAIGGCSVAVRVANVVVGSGAVATIYSDNGITTTPNPTFADSLGRFNFWVADGVYDLTYSGAGVTAYSEASVEMFDLTPLASGEATAGQQLVVNSTATGSVWQSKPIVDVRDFPAATVTAQINSAVAACGAYTGAAGNSCVVVIPASVACGEPSGQSPAHDNVVLWDFRNCAQSTGLRFNLSHTVSGNVRSKLFFQDNFDAGATGLAPNWASSSGYFLTYVDSPDASSGTIGSFNATVAVNSMAGNFTGPLIGGEFTSSANSTNGTPRTVSDQRGVLGNGGIGGNTSSLQFASVYGQAPTNMGTGTMSNAYAGIFERPTAGTVSNFSVWNKGATRQTGVIKLDGMVDRPTATTLGPSYLVGDMGDSLNTGALYFGGNNAGWQWCFRTRFASTDTTPWCIADNGNVTHTGNSIIVGYVKPGSYQSGTNCQLGGASGTTSPAACGSAVAGMIAVPASQTTYTVNTNAVTAGSEIFVQQMTDNSGLPGSPTCSATATVPIQSSRVAATSFSITQTSVAAVTCFKYWIVN